MSGTGLGYRSGFPNLNRLVFRDYTVVLFGEYTGLMGLVFMHVKILDLRHIQIPLCQAKESKVGCVRKNPGTVDT